MRYFQIIAESWHKTVELGVDNSVEIFKDPSRNDLVKMFRDYSQNGGVGKGLTMRALLTTDGSIYVWDAYYATHGDIENNMNDYPFAGGYLYLHPDYVFFNDMHYFANDEGEYDEQFAYRPIVRSFYERTVNNRSIRAYYGSNPKIIAIDSQPVISAIPTETEFEVTPEFIAQYVAPKMN